MLNFVANQAQLQHEYSDFVFIHLQKYIIESESLNHHFDKYFGCDNSETEFNSKVSFEKIS